MLLPPHPSQQYARFAEIVEKNGFDLMPLIEFVADHGPEYLESFCNRAIVTVAELLRDGQKGGVMAGDVYEIITQLHSLREAFRKARGAESWP